MALGKLTLGSNITCDFIHITRGKTTDQMGALEYEPIWDQDSKFLAKFDHTLRTGNLLPDGMPPTSWVVYRQKVNSDSMEFVTIVEGTEATCYDYMPANNTSYIYHSFARTESNMSEDKKSKPIKPAWDGWVLMTLDESPEADDLFVPHEIFLFQYNLEIGDMSNNTLFNKLDNFTRFPTIQRSSANHLSGQLKGLIGHVDCAGKYRDTLSQADAIQNLTTDTRRKILRDTKGRVMEVELMSNIVFSVLPGIITEPHAATLQWTQIGDASDVRVVVNV